MTHDELERRLRESLEREAERIAPRDRLEEIRAMARAAELSPARRTPVWLVPVSAAAAVALIAAVVWASGLGPGRTTGAPASSATSGPVVTTGPLPSATSTASTGSPTATTPATVLPTRPTGSPTTSAPTTTMTALPVYYIGDNGGGTRLALFREFVAVAMRSDATVDERARVATGLAMEEAGGSGPDYISAWAGTTVTKVDVTTDGITLFLDGPGPASLPMELARMGVQQLVWTAQAAVGRGTLPVTFRLESGDDLFGYLPVDQTYNRPAKDKQYQDLASIWIESPGRGQRLPAGRAVTISGSACTFEGTLRVTVEGPGGSSRESTVTASSGCPLRGTWSLNLGILPLGEYSVRAVELSPEDGERVIAEASRTFAVG